MKPLRLPAFTPRLVCIGLLFSLTIAAHAGTYKAPLEDVMLLPQYCWGQYDKSFQGPQYSISRPLCGPGMNHYCPGLLEYQKAQNALSRGERIRRLNVVLTDIHYTLQWMKDYPNCNIRGDVLQLQNRVLMDLGMPPLVEQMPVPTPAPEATPEAPSTGGAQANPAPGSAAQGDGQATSGASGDQLYPAPKIPPRADSKIGMPGNPYCRFCPD